uniref:YjeF N-terminal domain containing 3 n=1 Tax=Anas platyrhynchos platyrhynchos TaxID=8840 RepID=A0A493T183_ANAPP
DPQHRPLPGLPPAFPLPSLPRKQPTVLVVCGPAQNGAIGLVCARHLRIFDYEPTIFYPKRSPDPLYRDFTTQCEKMDIPFLSYLPTEVSPGRSCPPLAACCASPYYLIITLVISPPWLCWEPGDAMKSSGRPPRPAAGPASPRWDVEAGSSSGISPDVLVSLMAPKQCARRFLGRQHFVAGRFVPYDVQKKFELNPPEYPGTECVVPL